MLKAQQVLVLGKDLQEEFSSVERKNMNNKNIKHYEKLADILEYPKIDYLSKVKSAGESLSIYDAETNSIFRDFIFSLGKMPLEKIEELYLRTFDIQAVTTLDIGYVLFGDDYKRGKLLANLNQEHIKVSNDCGTELADYLPNLLRLLPKIEDDEFRDELVGIIILPALSKIISEFDVKNIDLKNKVYERKYKTLIEQPENYERIFLNPLLVIQKILEYDFGSSVLTEETNNTSFTESITTEIKID